MRVTGRSTTARGTALGGAGAGTVLAAKEGDPAALDALVAASLPLVYNIVGRALNGHPDVDDVVQETLLRVVRGLGELRQPEAFRSWLVAIAVRQVHDRERERLSTRSHRTDLDAAEQIADPASDFAGLTILRLGLTDQRRELAEATRWLDEDDRALLALWWLEETGELQRAELAEALGLSGRHAAVRVQRMKEQLEISRTVVRALQLQHDRPCGELGELVRSWDGVPSPLWRKRLARHIRGCGECGERGGMLYPMGQLLGGLPLLVPPPALLHHLGLGVPSLTGVFGGAGGTGHGAGTAAGRVGHRAARHGARRGARAALHGRLLPLSAAGATVAAVAVAAVLVSGLGGSPAKPGPVAAASAAGQPIPAVPSATVSSASPTPTPSATHTPSAKPSTRKPVAPPPPAVAVSSSRKGVGVWSFSGVDSALTRSGASWYYTWSTTHSGISTPARAGFVPMIWGAASVTPAALAQAKAAGPYLLGFNEPDMAAQSNMTVDQALSLWPKLMATGSKLGSPAVAYGGDTAGGWLDRFMSGAKAKGYRVDFITLHWYGGDFTTSDAVAQLRSYVQAVYNRYHVPIWLTEYALIDFSNGGSRFPTGAQQAAFVTASTKMLDGLPYLQRYAWFALPATDTAASSGLFRSGPVATAAGTAFEAAR